MLQQPLKIWPLSGSLICWDLKWCFDLHKLTYYNIVSEIFYTHCNFYHFIYCSIVVNFLYFYFIFKTQLNYCKTLFNKFEWYLTTNFIDWIVEMKSHMSTIVVDLFRSLIYICLCRVRGTRACSGPGEWWLCLTCAGTLTSSPGTSPQRSQPK